jgi:Na+-translocating ferredoxin:NAD+ oxidoreductase RnfG subunit
MPKSTNTCNSILLLLFNGTTFANIAINATAAPLTNLYVSLHTATPGIGDKQTTNETAYSSYARQPVARASGAGGWTVSTNSVNNTTLISFPQCGVTGSTISHVAIGTDVSGDGRVLYAGQLNTNLAVAQLIVPQFLATALTVTET